MELAVVDDHAAREQQVRLKLHFDDATILSAQQIYEGLCDCWFLTGPHLHSIAELASRIVIAFGLRSSCPYGISLRMENFTLPPSQPVGLLKDKDIVSINRKETPLIAAHQQGEHAISSSFDTFEKIGPLGITPHALEEFERETGGYESEEEEEKITCEDLLKDGDDKALKQSSTKSKEKKRKREKVDRKSIPSSATQFQVKHVDSSSIDTFETFVPLGIKTHGNLVQDVNHKGLKASTEKPKANKRKREKVQRIEEQGLEVVPYLGGVTNKKDKEKKSKKQRLIDQQVESEKLLWTNERQECIIIKEGQNSECSNAAKIKEKKKDKAKGDAPIKEHTAEKVIGSKNPSLAMSSSDDEMKDKEKTAVLRKEGEYEQKCSRSTRRKKAKRLWKRQNAGVTTKVSTPEDDSVKLEKAGGEHVRLSIPSKHEDDGDAEEERLPRVVRPGHVRFQASDEDNDDSLDPRQNLLPYLGWSNGISKRKGQSWGQERTKRGNNNFQATGDMEIDIIQELNFETLPAVQGTPQIGDVIAYRILELTTSFCPELSDYRVGKVLDLESHSGKLKLEDVPKYPTQGHNDHDAPSYKDGVLETQISSLAELRLVERSKVASPIQASIEMPVKENGTNMDIGADTMLDTSKMCNANSVSLEADSQNEKCDADPYQGWPEISDALQRKRDELASQVNSRAVGIAELGGNEKLENIHQPESQNVESTALTTVAELKDVETKGETRIAKTESGGGSSAGKTLSNGRGVGRGPRGWHKRAGGLGSTMALLRSQNDMLGSVQ